MSDHDKLLGGKTMGGINVGGKIYLREEDVRHAVNAALATNEARNKRIAELETNITALIAVAQMAREALAVPARWFRAPGPLGSYAEQAAAAIAELDRVLGEPT